MAASIYPFVQSYGVGSAVLATLKTVRADLESQGFTRKEITGIINADRALRRQEVDPSRVRVMRTF